MQTRTDVLVLLFVHLALLKRNIMQANMSVYNLHKSTFIDPQLGSTGHYA